MEFTIHGSHGLIKLRTISHQPSISLNKKWHFLSKAPSGSASSKQKKVHPERHSPTMHRLGMTSPCLILILEITFLGIPSSTNQDSSVLAAWIGGILLILGFPSTEPLIICMAVSTHFYVHPEPEGNYT